MSHKPSSLPSVLSPNNKQTPFYEHIHVVLVEPGNSLNIGAVARAMSNLGFYQLHLVAPPRLDWEQAKNSACWGAPLLKTATVHDSLTNALTDMQMVIGFTARHGRNRPRHLLLNDWVTEWHQSPKQQTALLFGSEDHGLRQEQLEYCHSLVRIPSLAQNPSFNLSQAVLLALFELSHIAMGSHNFKPSAFISSSVRDNPVSIGQLNALDTLLTKVLWLSGFYASGTPRPVPGLVRRMLCRLQPNERELSWLLGILGRIEGTLSQRVPLARGEPLQSKQGFPQPPHIHPEQQPSNKASQSVETKPTTPKPKFPSRSQASLTINKHSTNKS